jgi:hypothetical protein
MDPERTPQEIEARTINTLSSRGVGDNIFQQMQRATEIARSVSSLLGQFEAAKKRQPTGEIIGGLIGAGVAFLCGVLLPLFWRHVPVILLLWVPSGFYVIAFAYITSSLWQILMV